MGRTSPSGPSRQDLASLRNESAQPVYLFVVDIIDLIHAKRAYFPAHSSESGRSASTAVSSSQRHCNTSIDSLLSVIDTRHPLPAV